ncbi:MAG: helix-turn-helix domain-containing protein [Alphaproteobacteria bacterium]|nr:helix-turn-helix domain-containing protein [Alphaproteobacteria bacterium]
MQITNLLTDDAVLGELGARVQRQRLHRNVTQAALAEEAGVSTPTVQRLEAGASVQLASLLRVLRALGLLDRADGLVPEPGVRPMDLLEREGRRRQRASSPSSAAATDDTPWTWGE